MATVRYLVHDVEASLQFYTQQLDFELLEQFGSAMAIVKHGDLTLWLAGPQASASRPMPDGSKPEPGGGWNRFVIEVEDLAALVTKLKTVGAKFRNEIISGPGGQQILLEDPSGNIIEVFQAS
jgi:predicted enzyme related to lactoylglutathione lyase